MSCDLHQTGIYKKVLRKGNFKLNLYRNENKLKYIQNTQKLLRFHGELHGETIRLLDCTGWSISQGLLGSHPDITELIFQGWYNILHQTRNYLGGKAKLL